MITHILDYLRRNAIAMTALGCALLALAGAGYAAISLPSGSVGTRQLRNGAVTPAKLNRDVSGVRAWAVINSVPRVMASSGRVKVTPATAGDGEPGFNLWWRNAKLPRRANACSIVATPSDSTHYAGFGHVTVYSNQVGPGVTLSVDVVC